MTKITAYAAPGILHHETPELFMIRILAVMGLTPDQIRARTRRRDVVNARCILAHMISRRYPHLTLHQIGSMVGNVHHSTVIYYKRYVTDQLDVDKMFKENYLSIQKML